MRFFAPIKQISPKKSAFFPLSFSFRTILQSYDCKLPIEEAYTPAKGWYTSSTFYEKEIEHVWKKNWICIDSSLNLRETGQFKTGFLAEQPYIITKSEEEVKSFYNVCLHHGSIVETKTSGKCEHFVCPYHGWNYDLNGKLAKCSGMKGVKNFWSNNNKLGEIKSLLHGKMAFLNLDQNSKKDDFQLVLKNFDQAHVNRKIDPFFTNFEEVMAKGYNIDCNWKLFVENWLDGGYHLPYLHKGLTSELTQEYYIKDFPKLNIQESRGASERTGEWAIYSFIYPNCMIAQYGDWLDVSLIYPLSVDKCRVEMKWFIKENKKEDKKFIEESLEKSYEVQNEDVYICSLVAKGVKSDGYKKGRYAPMKESGMHNFHLQIYQDMEKALPLN